MGPALVVALHVTQEGGRALGGTRERPAVGPLAKQRLDEALSLAVGARVGPREAMSQAPRCGRPPQTASSDCRCRYRSADAARECRAGDEVRALRKKRAQAARRCVRWTST
jgi:hypothetical protein